MGKYIIDVKDGETLYKAVIAPDGEPYITPAMGNVYTAPDLEQVRKEAYKDGYDAGFGRKIDASYQEGLSDAWDAARKICLGMSEGGMNEKVLCDIFAVEYYRDALRDYSASEAIEKIRQYEREKEMDGLRQNIQTIVDQCGYTLDEIAEVLAKMKEADNG